MGNYTCFFCSLSQLIPNVAYSIEKKKNLQSKSNKIKHFYIILLDELNDRIHSFINEATLLPIHSLDIFGDNFSSVLLNHIAF